MHNMTRKVREEVQRLEFAQFQEPDARDRLNLIRALAEEQMTDDNPSMAKQRDRIGREHVAHSDPDFGTSLWRRWTPDQVALEDKLAPMLRDLSPKQAEVLHLLYWGRLTERQTALVLGITQHAVQDRRDRALANLRAAVKARLAPPEVVVLP